MSGKKVERNGGARAVGIDQGGTGATTAAGALVALGAVPSALMAKPLGCVPLDKDGRASPSDLGLSVAGQPAIVGPQEIAYGSRINYVITNFDSFLNYDVRAVAGSVVLRDDVIEYTAPPASSGLTKGGFSIGGRTYEIAFSVAKVAKPIITFPTEGTSLQAMTSYVAKASAFSLAGGTAIKTGELQGKGSTVLTAGSTGGGVRTIRFVGRGGSGYMLGGIAVKGQDAVIRQNGTPIATFPGGLGVTAPLTNLNGIPFTEGMQVSFDIPDSNEIKYFIYDEAGVLGRTEWQIATTPDFAAPIVSTGQVTNFNNGLPLDFQMNKGQHYYIRMRQQSVDGTTSEWSDTVSFYYQYESGVSGDLYKFHSKVKLLDHPLGYGTDTKQIDVLRNGYAFAKGYATVWQNDPLSVNWNYRNDFAPSTTGGKPRAISFVDYNDGDGELVLLESPDSLQNNKMGKLRYGGAHVPAQVDDEIDVSPATSKYVQPFYPGTVWSQTLAKDVPTSLAVSPDGVWAFTMTANENHVFSALRTEAERDSKQPYRYTQMVVGNQTVRDYVNGYFNIASLYEFYAINRTNKPSSPTEPLHVQKYHGGYNFRRRRADLNADLNTKPNLLVGQNYGLSNPDENQIIVVAPRKSWRPTYDKLGLPVASEMGSDVVITTFMQNGRGSPTTEPEKDCRVDLLLHTLNGRVDGKRVPNTQWETALSKFGNNLFVADIADYNGRGVVSVYRGKKASHTPFKKQKFSGSLTFRSLQQEAGQGYQNPTGTSANFNFSANALMGIPTTVIIPRVVSSGSITRSNPTFHSSNSPQGTIVPGTIDVAAVTANSFTLSGTYQQAGVVAYRPGVSYACSFGQHESAEYEFGWPNNVWPVGSYASANRGMPATITVPSLYQGVPYEDETGVLVSVTEVTGTGGVILLRATYRIENGGYLGYYEVIRDNALQTTPAQSIPFTLTRTSVDTSTTNGQKQVVFTGNGWTFTYVFDVTNNQTSYTVNETFYLDEFSASPGVEAPVTNFMINVTYVNSSQDAVYEAGHPTVKPVRARYTGTLTVNADPDSPYDLFSCHWDLQTVIAADAAGMRFFGHQIATNNIGTVLVVGYMDTNAANAVRYRVYEWADYKDIAGGKQAISIASVVWTRTAASAGVSIATTLPRNNDVAFAPNSNLGVTGISPALSYEKDRAIGTMVIESINVANGIATVNYRDTYLGATVSYSADVMMQLNNFKQVATITPSFADGNCVAVSDDGKRVFVGKAGEVEVFQR